jgi:hypothetical protein
MDPIRNAKPNRHDNATFIAEFAMATPNCRARPGRIVTDRSSRSSPMRAAWYASLACLLLAAAGHAIAGQVALPTDIAVGMSASPSTGLAPRDRITITLSATNLGPAPAPTFVLIGSDLVGQFDLSSVTTDCNDLILVVSDGQDSHSNYWWYPSRLAAMPVGTAVQCHLRLSLTPAAPPVTPFQLALPDFIADINAANDSATVLLQREALAIPTLGAPAKGLLIVGLVLLALLTPRRHRRPDGGGTVSRGTEASCLGRRGERRCR